MVGVGSTLFLDLGLIVIITALATFFLRLLRQPPILAYVLVGVLMAPIFGIVVDQGLIESMSLVGIAFLLFIVGLEMDLKSLRSVALVSTLGGLIETIILFVFGYLISLLLGFLTLEAAYIGLMLAFSSTMVVMKLLSDKRELQTLHGRIIIGTLLMQDLIAIFALSVLTAVNEFSSAVLGIALIKFLVLFLIAYMLSKFVFPSMFRFAAKNQELLLILSLGVCFFFSLAFEHLGFSIAIGAFIAGITLGNLDYRLEIISKVKSLKDFFSLLFFVSLGLGLSFGIIKKMWIPFVVILALVLIVKPFVVTLVCCLFKFTKKPSFLTANALAQVGEFSLILAMQGLVLGHLSRDLFSLVVIIVLVTITITSYYMEYARFFYRFFAKPLSFFDRFTTSGVEYLRTRSKPKYVLCGHNRIGYSILQSLRKQKEHVLVVDYNPEVIAQVVKQGYHCLYGDVADDEIIEKMNLEQVSMLISTVPEMRDNLLLIRRVRAVNKNAKLIVAASDIDESLELYAAGADYVVLPHFLGGEHVSNLISDVRNHKLNLKETREQHIRHLHERRILGQDHPK